MSGLFGSPSESHAEVLKAYVEEFRRAEDRWKALEAKAQGAITIAGIFMGFTLTFAKDIPAISPRSILVETLAAIVVLVMSIIAAASSLLITDVAEPPGGAVYAQFSDDFQTLAPNKAEFERASWPAIRARWQSAITARNNKNSTKARAVHVSQGLLFLSILIAAGIASETAWLRVHNTTVSTPTNGVIIYEMR